MLYTGNIMKQEIKALIAERCEDHIEVQFDLLFGDIAEDFDVDYGDITPDQAFRLSDIKKSLTILLVEYVIQNNGKYGIN